MYENIILIASQLKIYRNSPVTKKLQPILDLKRSKLYMKTAKGKVIKVFKAFMIEKKRPIAWSCSMHVTVVEKLVPF